MGVGYNQVMPTPLCPRCKKPLGPDTEQDYGFCFTHGTVYLGVPFEPISALKSEQSEYRKRRVLTR